VRQRYDGDSIDDAGRQRTPDNLRQGRQLFYKYSIYGYPGITDHFAPPREGLAVSSESRLDPAQQASDRLRRCSRAPIPFVRANALAPFVGFFDSIGAPVGRLLGRARLSPSLLEDPEALVPTLLVFRFVELAALQEGVEDLGVLVAQRTSPFELGAYGAALQESATVHEYLKLGIGLIGSHSNGTRLWMTREPDGLRINQFLVGPPGRGHCIGDVFTLVITLNTLRQFFGPTWSPGEVRLLAGDETLVGDRAVFGEAKLITGQRHTSFTIDPVPGDLPASIGRSADTRDLPRCFGAAPCMPMDFQASVEQLVQSLMVDGHLEIDNAAEAAGMSSRTLQRRLAEKGLTYAGLVSKSRLRIAKTWLAESDMPVGEIAIMLGYSEATNFARAFRREVGASPLAYRRSRQRG
jgi:AraC-like DNA-binding protein